ncbi:Protein of unknown function [Pyronema omphalodes CBS 100304]|uniref:Uncharacterized protein n=1 Tax=Pyronema omphalodes (strain CBS 100304) TaxID=1076935 RepID=U4LRQ8_PYROM|nr:Protein of unknown function [Pyronema omphalodes CBS 100304]
MPRWKWSVAHKRHLPKAVSRTVQVAQGSSKIKDCQGLSETDKGKAVYLRDPSCAGCRQSGTKFRRMKRPGARGLQDTRAPPLSALCAKPAAF